jgi:hypothetical protein
MNEIAIFGKPGSIAKYDLTKNKSLWIGQLEPKYIPYSISQYKNYVLVFSYSKWGTKSMIHCFTEDAGELLWFGLTKNFIKAGFPFYPHVLGDCLYFMASPKEVAKLNLQSGKLLFKKTFEKSMFRSYRMIIISDQVYLLSSKDAKIIDKNSGAIQACEDIGNKINLKEISASLGNGTSFMSSISLTHPQPGGDGSAAMMAGDAGGGGE